MKILLIADGHGSIYAEAFFKGFNDLGHDVFLFTWKEYFHHYQYADYYETDGNLIKSIYYRFQNKFIFGPEIIRINKDIIKKCIKIKPELVFIYRGTHVYPKTLREIKNKINCKIFGYNNDDPFSEGYPKYFWRHFKKGIKYYDHVFSFRHKNIHEYHLLGYDKVSLLRAYYIKERNFYLKELPTEKYRCDVIFIGHFEDDGRDEIIATLIDNKINIKLYGPLWEKSRYFDYFKKKFGEIKPLYGEDYNVALNSAKIALVFLSKLNNDTYTRKCFEILATKTMMMAEYTDDLNSMFEEGKEAEYFRSKEELLTKIKFYLANSDKISEIGCNGYNRLIKDGYEVRDRCKEVLKIYEMYQNSK